MEITKFSLTAKDLRNLITQLYYQYLKLPAKINRSFDDVYICIWCKKLKEDEEPCECKIKKKKIKDISKKKKKITHKKKKKKVKFPKALINRPIK